MKKVISISLIVLVMFSGIRLDVASHFCKGRYIASRVSFSGKLASCGMEDHPVFRFHDDILTNQCCEDQLASFSIYSKYFSTQVNQLPVPLQAVSPAFIPGIEPIPEKVNLSIVFPGKNIPPGSFSPTEVTQQSTCIYRI